MITLSISVTFSSQILSYLTIVLKETCIGDVSRDCKELFLPVFEFSVDIYTFHSIDLRENRLIANPSGFKQPFILLIFFT